MFPMETEGERAIFVRQMREQLSCDQQTFAGIVGVSTAAVSRWENDRAEPHDRHWEQLHDLDEELMRRCDSERLIAMLKIAAALGQSRSPLKLLVRGELEEELRYRLEEIDLNSGANNMELYL